MDSQASSSTDSDSPDARLSTHERRQAKLAKQIRQLEAESIAKRSWTLSGEFDAAHRPFNSLLAEHLEFERTGKPVSVPTQEVTDDLDGLIKRRIQSHDFDELIRRRPNNLDESSTSRRGLAEPPETSVVSVNSTRRNSKHAQTPITCRSRMLQKPRHTPTFQPCGMRCPRS
jgi:U3 small nucleolar RNA-associated protein MPP10